MSRLTRRLKPVYPVGRKALFDYPNLANIAKSYINLAATGSGTSGSNTITASASVANLVQAGMRLRIGGTDVYTVSTVSTTTITTVETLTASYASLTAMALERISAWNDTSGQGLSAATGSNLVRPVYSFHESINREAVLYDGVNTLSVNSGFTLANGAFTVYAVAKRLAEDGVAQYIYSFNQGASVKGYLRFGATAGEILFLNSTTTGAVTKTGGTNTGYQIITASFDGVSAQSVQINNGTAATNTSGLVNGSIDGFQIGRQPGGNPLIGGIAKLFFYDTLHTAVQKTHVARILSAETGIPVS